MLEELWPDPPAAADAASTVLVISAHGALNFAAALSVLRPLAPQEHAAPLLRPMQSSRTVSGRHDRRRTLRVPVLSDGSSAAKFAYLEKRLAARLPEAKIIGLAWQDSEGANALIKPEHALELPAAASADVPEKLQNQPELSLQHLETQ